MGKWTDQGFVTQTVSDYKIQLQQVFRDAYGPDFLLDEALPQGVIINGIAEMFYNADMDSIEVLSRLNPNTASGIWLDIIGILRGYPRLTGTPQKLTVQITSGASGLPFTIPQGQEFTVTETGDRFILTNGATINSATTVLADAFEYTQTGNSGAGLNNHLTTTGIGNITDMVITAMADGTSAETDIEYRARLLKIRSVASNTIEYTLDEISKLQNVRAVGCNYNDSDETVDTLPPYSTEFMAVPDSSIDTSSTEQYGAWKTSVATTILNNKVPGAPTAGNTTVTGVIDVFGNTKTVNFTVPSKVSVEISVTIGTREETGYVNLTTIPEIKKQIAAYINGLNIGVDVSYSKCLEIILKQVSFDITSFKIRRIGASSWAENANLVIGSREYANIAEANITIGS